MSIPIPVPAAGGSASDGLGRPLHDLRLSIIDACNFRCTYCMPAERGTSHVTPAKYRLTFDEIESIARGFVRVGVRKIRLTGGEPLLRRDLLELVSRLSRISGVEDIAITTNGALLAPHAIDLRRAGLTRITVSLDTLDRSQFQAITGRDELERVLAGISAANAAGLDLVKINCVVKHGLNDDQVLPMASAFRGTRNVLRFIEFMDVGTCNGWTRSQVVESARLREIVDSVFRIVPIEPLHTCGVA